ncbi:S-methyl-5'-thioadenosine phosphorylase, partial [Candidatus Bathyarchaeota archaeon]|nr:S-methyl-5'-thioadenosine phosphorylase [Candidatus Bathyarchaeota archaeon]
MSKPSADLAIIGGTGVYDPELIDNAERVKVHTPYGSPSATITIGEYEEKR